jgi:hypothetical protein
MPSGYDTARHGAKTAPVAFWPQLPVVLRMERRARDGSFPTYTHGCNCAHNVIVHNFFPYAFSRTDARSLRSRPSTAAAHGCQAPLACAAKAKAFVHADPTSVPMMAGRV